MEGCMRGCTIRYFPPLTAFGAKRSRNSRACSVTAPPDSTCGAGQRSDLLHEVHRSHGWKDVHRNYRNGAPWHPLP
jgi:hypothetical protein